MTINKVVPVFTVFRVIPLDLMMETAPCDDLTPDISHHTTDLGGSVVQRET